MGWYSALRIYQPGGIVNQSGDPNFLRDLSSDCYQAQWTELFQGGLDQATFDLRLKYEDTVDILTGNWVVFGCQGANLHSHASIGDGSLTLDSLPNVQSGFNDIIHGDFIMITDGVNAELFKVNSISGGGPTWTCNLDPALNNTSVEVPGTTTQTIQNTATSVTVDNPSNFNNGDKVVFSDADTVTLTSANGAQPITWSGSLSQGYPSGTPLSKAAAGATVVQVVNPQSIIGGSTTVTFDSGRSYEESVLVDSVNYSNGKLTLHTALANSHAGNAPVVFQMPAVLQNNYAANVAIVVRVLYQGYITQRVHNTIRPDQFSIHTAGFFSRYNFAISSSTVNEQDSGKIMLHDAGSYAKTFTEMIVKASNFDRPTGININVQATLTPFIEIVDTILRQENGSKDMGTEQYAMWTNAERLLFHLPVATVEPYQKSPPSTPPTYFMSLADLSSGIAGNVLFGVTVSVYGDTIASLQNTDMDGTSLMNAAIVTGTTNPNSSSYNRNTATEKTSESAGSTSIPVESVPASFPSGASSNLFLYFCLNQPKNPRELTAYGGYSGTTLTIPGGGVQYNHSEGDPIQICTKCNGSPTGKTNWSVLDGDIFQSGDQITISPTGVTAETVTILSKSGNNLTTTKVNKSHGGSDVVVLATKGGQAPQILVELLASISNFGWFEGTLSSQDIFDESQLAKWGKRQLAILGWPQAKIEVQLNNTPARVTGRDLLCIGPFNDNSYLVQNLNQARFTATAADANISGTLELSCTHSTMSGFIKQKHKEHAIRHHYHQRRHRDNMFNKQGVHHGFDINQTDQNNTGTGSEVTIDAGTVEWNGGFYPVSATTIALPDGESHWGVDCHDPGNVAPTIVELPKRYWNGRFIYGDATYTIADQGDDPVLVDQFVGVPLYMCHVVDGSVMGWKAHWVQRGTGLKNMPLSTNAPNPNVTSASSSGAGTQSLASTVSVTLSVDNFPPDNQAHSIKIYTCPTGSGNWAHKATKKIPGLPVPSQSQTITFKLTDVPLGNNIDVGISFDGLSGETSIIMALSNISVANPPPGILYVMAQATAPTPGSSTPTPTNGPGTLLVVTGVGTGINARLWTFDDVHNWQPYTVMGP